MTHFEKILEDIGGWKAYPPIYISFMLNCYFSAEPEEALGTDHWNSSAGKEVREYLKNQDLIDDENRATSRGEAWVDLICSTPLPVQKWIDPRKDNAA